MLTSLPMPALARYISRQTNTFFPDDVEVTDTQVEQLLPQVLESLGRGLTAFRNRYFWKDGQTWFDHLNGDIYSLLLHRLGHTAGSAGPEFQNLAVKSYLLNKALHGLDAYYQVKLPEACWLAHAVGSVIGRAHYGGPVVIMQGCTLGNRAGLYPALGSRVVMCAQSTLIGECEIGDDVVLGAGTLLVGVKVPSGSTVVGRYPEHRILPQRSPILDAIFQPGV